MCGFRLTEVLPEHPTERRCWKWQAKVTSVAILAAIGLGLVGFVIGFPL
jgi:hypothetical protein